jgi:hypothetical protein
MAWTDSRIFRQYMGDKLTNAQGMPLLTDTVNVALYNNTTTPNQNETTQTLTAYNGAASQWVVANEVTSSTTGWPAGGNALASKAVDQTGTSGVVFFSAANLSSSTSGATITNAYGCLVYDNSATPKQGYCYNYFGGANSVTTGTFTISWSANGIMRFTL